VLSKSYGRGYSYQEKCSENHNKFITKVVVLVKESLTIVTMHQQDEILVRYKQNTRKSWMLLKFFDKRSDNESRSAR
jgi:endo-1,4-beta-mannosidase